MGGGFISSGRTHKSGLSVGLVLCVSSEYTAGADDY